jgi:hypothetical protein
MDAPQPGLRAHDDARRWSAHGRPSVITSLRPGVPAGGGDLSPPPSAGLSPPSLASSWSQDTPINPGHSYGSFGAHARVASASGQSGGSGGSDWNNVFSAPLDEATFSALAARGIIGPVNGGPGSGLPSSVPTVPAHLSRFGRMPVSSLAQAPSQAAWDAHQQHRPHYSSHAPASPHGAQASKSRGPTTSSSFVAQYVNPFDVGAVPPGAPISGTDTTLLPADWGSSSLPTSHLGLDPALWPGAHVDGTHHGHLRALGRVGSDPGFPPPYAGEAGAGAYRSPADALLTSPVEGTFADLGPDGQYVGSPHTAFPGAPRSASPELSAAELAQIGADGAELAADDPRAVCVRRMYARAGGAGGRMRELTLRMMALELTKQREHQERVEVKVEDAAPSTPVDAQPGPRGRALNKGKATVHIVGFDDGSQDADDDA